MDKKSSILLVDDAPANLRVLVDSLKENHYELLTATSGQRALRIAEKARPDLILLDIKIPDIDGLETCLRLKANGATKEIPVIFLSALSEVTDKIKGFEVGGVDYITKPFQKAEVLVRVETHLKISRLTRELAESLTKQKELSDRLLALSIKDPLTDLYNRRYFFERIEEEIKRAKRRESVMAISVFDADFFKHVNDTYGHLCGDFILKELSAIIRRNIRETDLLARFGGEEFVVAFFDLEPDAIERRLELIREAVESHRFVFANTEIRKTVSIGFTVYRFIAKSEVSVQHLISEADSALYRAKETGRNRVVSFADCNGAQRASRPGAVDERDTNYL